MKRSRTSTRNHRRIWREIILLGPLQPAKSTDRAQLDIVYSGYEWLPSSVSVFGILGSPGPGVGLLISVNSHCFALIPITPRTVSIYFTHSLGSVVNPSFNLQLRRYNYDDHHQPCTRSRRRRRRGEERIAIYESLSHFLSLIKIIQPELLYY